MSEMRLNQRQLGVFRTVVAEAQTAQNALNTAQAKVSAFFESIKAQFDIPDEVQSLEIQDDGVIRFTIPTPPSDLPPHPMVQAAAALLGATPTGNSGLSLVEPPAIDIKPESEHLDG